jgi:hypothetical protein
MDERWVSHCRDDEPSTTNIPLAQEVNGTVIKLSKAEKSSKASNKLSLEDAKQLMFWLMKREERRTKLEDEEEKAAG